MALLLLFYVTTSSADVIGSWSDSGITSTVEVGNDVRITMTGFNDGWFAVGFGGNTMAATASAIVVENGVAPYEKVLGSQTAGTDPPAVLTVVSDTRNGPFRIVVVTRPIAGGSGTYTFPSAVGSIDVIWAAGMGAYAYHMGFRGVGMIDFAVPTPAPPTAPPTDAPSAISVVGSWSGSGITSTVEVGTEVKITMTGPNVGYFSVGFGGNTMAATASAIVVENGVAPYEKVLGSQTAGTDPPAVLTVISDTVDGANRVVVVTRPIAGGSGTYTFPTAAGSIDVIWASGAGAYVYHDARGASSIQFAAPVITPIEGTWSGSGITSTVEVGNEVRITMTGPNVGYFSVGFGGNVMTNTASAIVVENGVAPYEKVLGSYTAGTDPPAVLTVVSDTVDGANRVVVVTRPIAGGSGTYTFPVFPGSIDVIWASGAGAYVYHDARGASSMDFAAPVITPIEGTWSGSGITSTVEVGNEVRITMTGFNDGWFAVGFGGNTMATTASAIVVENGVAPYEKVLGSQTAGTDPPAVLTVVSDTRNGPFRIVVVTRPIAGGSGTYTFPSAVGSIDVIWAAGMGAYAYHMGFRGVGMIDFAVPTPAPPTAPPTDAPSAISVVGSWSGSGITSTVEVGTEVKITMTGPNVGYFAVGFGGNTMTNTASAIVVENGVAPYEKVLGSQTAGTDPPAVLTVISDTVDGANRVVVVTRPIAGGSGTYTFPTAAGSIDVIWASGAGAYVYHDARGASSIQFAAPVITPIEGTWSGSGITSTVEVGNEVRITMTGPNVGYFSVGFGGNVMTNTASAIVVENGVAPYEKVLGSYTAGTDPPAVLTVVSDTVDGANRVVVVTRPIAGGSGTYTFPVFPGSIDVIWASGAGAYVYHDARGASSMDFAAPVITPIEGTWSGSGITSTVEVGNEVRITMTGFNDGWFAVGFGGNTMATTASAIVVENGVAPYEKVLGSQTAGTDPPAVLTVVSDTRNGPFRIVVVTRPIAGGSGTYTFPSAVGSIDVIWAAGMGAYAYHMGFRGVGMIDFAVPTPAPPTAPPTDAPSAISVVGSWSGSGITSTVEVGTEVKITMTGPNVGYFSVGFGGNTMAATASAIVVENGVAPYEKVLGSQTAGTDPPAVLTVISDTVDGANRVVVVTRPIAGGSGTYTFPTAAGSIDVIWASGAGAYVYHDARGASSIQFAAPVITPIEGTWSGSGITSTVEVGNEVRITMTGPNVGYFSVGFGGNVMTNTASAIVVENGVAPYEKVLGSYTAGTDPPAVLTVVSDTVDGANRVVVVTRPIAGGSGTYTFPVFPGSIDVIWASGAGAYVYHDARGAEMMTFTVATPVLPAARTDAPSTTSFTGSWSGSGITSTVEVETEVRITMTGPNVGYFSVGFGGNTMTNTASAIVVENGVAPYEKVLGSQTAGTDPPAVLTVVSDTVDGANRVVVVTRPIAGGSGTYAFPTAAGSIDVIWASGAGAYVYHNSRGDGSLTFVSSNPAATPAPISDAPPTAVPTAAPPTAAPPSISTISSDGIIASDQVTGVTTDVRFSSDEATITVRGPPGVWFGVAFGQIRMMPTATAFIITSGSPTTVEERTLTDRSEGTLIDSIQGDKIVSDAIVGGMREVVFMRTMAGQGESFTFDTTAASVEMMTAMGRTADYTSGHSVSSGLNIGASAQVFSQQFSLTSLNFDENKFQMVMRCQVGLWCGISLGTMEDGRSITCREPGLCENSKLVISGPQPEAIQKVTVTEFAVENGFFTLTATFDEVGSGFVSGAAILWSVGTVTNGNLDKHEDNQRGGQFLATGGTRDVGDDKTLRIGYSMIAIVLIAGIGLVSGLMYYRYNKNGPDFISKKLFNSHAGTIIAMIVVAIACTVSYFASYSTDEWWYGTANPAVITLTTTLLLSSGSIGQLVKISRERLITYHRWLGVSFLLFSSIHGIGYLIDSSNNDILDLMWKTDDYKGAAPLYGVLSLLCTFLMFSLSFIRRRWYHIFLYSHWISAILVLFFSCLHSSTILIPVSVASGFIVISAIYKFIQPAAVVREKISSEDGQYTKMKVSIKNQKPCTYGSYYNVGVKGDMFQTHPFSVVKNGSTVDFIIKNMGPGTSTDHIIKSIEESDTVRLEGPFGVPTVMPQHYERVILCAGGVGVTPLVGIMNMCAASKTDDETEMQSTPGNSESAKIHLHWSCRDVALLELVAPYLNELETESVHTFLYYTGGGEISHIKIPANVTVTSGRPDYSKVFISGGSLFQETNTDTPAGDVGVYTCGPELMEKSVLQAIDSCEYRGALVVHSETFLM